MMKRLTEKRIAEILSRAEVCDDSVLTDYADIAAAMREILDIRKQNELLREELELRIADAKLYRVAFENADAELQERKKESAEPIYQCEFCHKDDAGDLQWHWEDVNKDFYDQYDSGRRGRRRVVYAVPQPVLVVHDGWKLVPQEPTDEMIEAMHGVDGYSENDVISSLRDAIAAAPKPPINDLPGGGTGE